MSQTVIVKRLRSRTVSPAPAALPYLGPRLLTIEQVCEWLGITGKTLLVWRRRHGFPTIEVDGWIRFDSESVESWLAEREQRSGQDAA